MRKRRLATGENNQIGSMMAADDKKAEPKEKAPPKEKTGAEAPAKDKATTEATPAADAKTEAKPEAKPDAPKRYSRGEGQKAVTQAYKDNWNAIYGKKKKKR